MKPRGKPLPRVATPQNLSLGVVVFGVAAVVAAAGALARHYARKTPPSEEIVAPDLEPIEPAPSAAPVGPEGVTPLEPGGRR